MPNLEMPAAEPKRRRPKLAAGTVPPPEAQARAEEAIEDMTDEAESLEEADASAETSEYLEHARWTNQDERERADKKGAAAAAEVDREGREEIKRIIKEREVSLSEAQRRMTEPKPLETSPDAGWAGRAIEGLNPGKARAGAERANTRTAEREAEAIRRAHAELASEAVDELVAEEKKEDERNWGTPAAFKAPAEPVSRWERFKSWFSGK